MKKWLLLIFLISPLAWSKSQGAYDAKLMKVLKREYKAAFKLWSKKPSSRNYYRVYNSRVEILNIQSKKLRALKFKKANSVAAKKLERKNLAFYKKTKNFGDQIDKKFSKFANQGKFYLMQGLLIFEYENNSREAERYFLKAIKYLKDRELKNNASGKLGDYYFNLRAYNKAIKYYSLALKIKKDTAWTDRYYYNMAWCFFKLDQFDNAVRSLYAIYKYTKKKNPQNYYYQESLSKIPQFYVFAGYPDKGFAFVQKTKVDDGRALFDYIKYVYEKGFFSKFDAYIIRIEKLLERKRKYNSLLSFRVEMYNFLVSSEFKKTRRTMVKLRKDILSYLKEGKLDKDLVQQFANLNLKLLGENFKRINKKDFSRRDRYFKPIMEDTITLLQTMIEIEPKKRFTYEIRYAQVLRKAGNKRDALSKFEQLYGKIKNKKSRTAGKLLDEIISLYSDTSLGFNVNAEKEKQYYIDYIRYGRDPKAKKIIYLKLYDIYYKNKDYKNSLVLTKKYHQKYPGESSQVELMLLKIATAAQQTQNEYLVKSLKDYIAKDPTLSQSAQLQKVTSASYQNLVLGKINALLKEDKGNKNDIAQKLVGFYKNNEVDRVNRVISGFNAGLLFHKLGSFGQAGGLFSEILRNSLPDEFTSYSPRIQTLASEGLMINPTYSLGLLGQIYSKSCELNSFTKEKNFLSYLEALLMHERFSEVERHVGTITPCKISPNVKNSIYSLVYEYTNFTEARKISSALRVILISNGQESVNDFVQEYIKYVFNEVSTLEKSDFSKIYEPIESMLATTSQANSPIYEDFKNVLSTGIQTVNYQSMPLSLENLESFLEKNLGLFLEKTKSLADYPTKYPLVLTLKDVVQVTLFEDMIKFMEQEVTKIQSPVQIEQIGDLINQALDPFREKLKTLKNARLIKKDQYVLRYISLNMPQYFIYPNKTFYVQGRE